MKKLRRRLSGALFALAGSGIPAAAALTPTDWAYQQSLNAGAPGLIKVVVPAATYFNAQPALADLRVVNSAGQEVSYLLETPKSRRELDAAAQSRAVQPEIKWGVTEMGLTQVVVTTGVTDALGSLDFTTSAPYFLFAAHVEILSTDEKGWESLGPAFPLFRHFGAEQLRLPLGRRTARAIRMTFDESFQSPGDFKAHLWLAPRAELPTPAPVATEIVRREEFSGETVLTVRLPGNHLPLSGLSLDTPDSLFMRRVTVSVRKAVNDIPTEALIGGATIYRIELKGAPVRSELAVPVEAPSGQEIMVHIHNGDSPPLAISKVEAEMLPATLFFLAQTGGQYRLLSGNPRASAVHYDLAAFAGEFHRVEAAVGVPGNIEAVPNHPAVASTGEDPLPELSATGALIETTPWRISRAVQVSRVGVQELELDPAVLAHSQTSLDDLRLVRNGNQIPYVIERTNLYRSVAVTPTLDPDAARPTVSRWKIVLPHDRLPFHRLVLTSSTALFQRHFRFYEKRQPDGGSAYESTFVQGDWSRLPGPGVPASGVFYFAGGDPTMVGASIDRTPPDLQARLESDTLWFETDNGDNPPVVLTSAKILYPVIRLVFKIDATDGITLIYGNRAVIAPNYDLRLVAERLLTSSRNSAGLSAEDPNASRHFIPGRNAGIYFWAALGAVVVVLLVIVARLLPKPAG